MRVLLLTTLAALLLCPSALAFHRDSWIEQHLPRSSGVIFKTPVYCAESQEEWGTTLENLFGEGAAEVAAFTDISTGFIFINPQDCSALDEGPQAFFFPTASAALYHEWVHSYFREVGAEREGNAECVSLFFYQYALINFWGVDPAAANNYYSLVWQEHVLRAGVFPEYLGHCLYEDAYGN